MTFLRLTANFSSLQLTDICNKVTSHAKSSAKINFRGAKLFKARKTPKTSCTFPGYKEPCLLATRGENAKSSKQAFSKLSK